MKHSKDDSGKLEELANRIIEAEEDYAPLKHLKILFTWRFGKPKRDLDGGFIAAQASVLSNRLRDIFGWDVQVEVSRDIWDTLNARWKRRLLWHELRHFGVEMTEDEASHPIPERDKENRIVVTTVTHDISLRTFRAEIDKFGIDEQELDIFRFISTRYVRAKKGKLKKYARPASLVDDENNRVSQPAAKVWRVR